MSFTVKFCFFFFNSLLSVKFEEKQENTCAWKNHLNSHSFFSSSSFLSLSLLTNRFISKVQQFMWREKDTGNARYFFVLCNNDDNNSNNKWWREQSARKKNLLWVFQKRLMLARIVDSGTASTINATEWW